MTKLTLQEQLIADRRHLHAHPEEGWCEFETTWFIVQRLKALGLEWKAGIDVIEPSAVMGRNADLVEKAKKRALEHGVPADCLPIEESNDPAHEANAGNYRSVYPGFSHACGHDGHTAVGLAAARWLSENREKLCGTVKILFQPAEEGVRGAAAMAAKGIVDDVNWFAGAHIGCSARLGQVGVSHFGYLATTKFDLRYHGLAAAAGSPEKGRSALMCGAATCMSLGSLPGHSQGITRVQIGRFESGTGRNIIAENAFMQLEVRGESTEINDYMAANVEMTVKGLAAAYGVDYELTRMGEAVTYRGDEEAVSIVKEVAAQVPGVDSVVDMNAKIGSEDCTMLIRRVQEHGGKAVFFYYGCNHPGHHRGDFCIQDETSLPIGFGCFVGFIQRINGVFLMKLFDFEKEHWRISYFASAKAEMLLTSSRRINTREDVKI